MTTAQKYLASPGAPILVIVLAAAAWLSWNAFDRDDSLDPRSATGPGLEQPFLVEAAAIVPSDTAEDWAGAADVVVTGTVVDEIALQPPVSETEQGVDQQLLGRTVTVKIGEVLWRSPDASVADPTTITINAMGWARSDDGIREVAVEGASRVEVGHKYVFALVWQPAKCAEGDHVPARWTWIGSGGVIPADNGVLGNGEVEGSTQTVAETRSDSPADSVEAENVGQGVTAVKDDLRAADDDPERTWPEPRDNACP